MSEKHYPPDRLRRAMDEWVAAHGDAKVSLPHAAELVCAPVAEVFNVSISAISAIIRGDRWAKT